METKFESPGARGVATLTRVTYNEQKKVGGTPCKATRNNTQLAEGPKPTQQGGLRPSSLTLLLFGARRSVGETGSGATLGGWREPGKRADLTVAVLGVTAAAAQRRIFGLASLPRRPGCGGRSHFIIRPGAQEASAPQ